VQYAAASGLHYPSTFHAIAIITRTEGLRGELLCFACFSLSLSLSLSRFSFLLLPKKLLSAIWHMSSSSLVQLGRFNHNNNNKKNNICWFHALFILQVSTVG